MKKGMYFSLFVIIFIASCPYFSGLPFRLDQILIPVIILTFLYKIRIPKNIGIFLLLISIFITLFSTFINLTKSELFVGYLNLIRELQNIFKPLVYLMLGLLLWQLIGENEKIIHLSLKIVVVIFFLFTLTDFISVVISGPYNTFQNFMKEYYHVLPLLSSSFRFPGILAQPATAGVFFVFAWYFSLKFSFSAFYKVLIMLTGLLAVSKIFIFSLPYVIITQVIDKLHKKEMYRNSTIKKSHSTVWIMCITLLIPIIIIIFSYKLSYFSNFVEVFGKMNNYFFKIFVTDPTAGRSQNFVTEGIIDVLSTKAFLGRGFTTTSNWINLYGLWDSGIFYELYLSGITGFVLKTIAFFLIFNKAFVNSKKDSIVFYLFIFLTFLSNYGIPVFYQERVADIVFTITGYYLGVKYYSFSGKTSYYTPKYFY